MGHTLLRLSSNFQRCSQICDLVRQRCQPSRYHGMALSSSRHQFGKHISPSISPKIIKDNLKSTRCTQCRVIFSRTQQLAALGSASECFQRTFHLDTNLGAQSYKDNISDSGMLEVYVHNVHNMSQTCKVKNIS